MPTVTPDCQALLPRILAVFASRRTFLRGRIARLGRRVAPAAVLALAATASGQTPAPSARPAPPAPDVYLATIVVTNGAPTVGTPMNITARPGYDNQPNFFGDGASVLFTSVRDDAQADIYRYDVASGRTTRVTTTAPESEYSATPIDGGRAVSVVRVERDSTQRLWRFPLEGGDPSVILERVKPVGYHAWADDHTLALFVLGAPNTLQLADTHTGTVDTLATGIGRSLHRMPRGRQISFVRKVSPAEWWIESLDITTRQTTRLVRLPEAVEDYAWLPQGGVVCGQGSTLLWWSGSTGVSWRPIADLASAGIKGITRLAVSGDGKRIAFVADGK